MTKPCIAVLVVCVLSPVVAHAGGTAYYRADKALVDCAEGKKNAAAQQQDATAKQALVAKAKPSEAKQLEARLAQDFAQRQQADAARVFERMWRVAKLVRKARHLDAILPVGQGADVSEGVDLTAEVVRRMDAGEGVADAEVIADLQKKLAESNAERDRLKKAKPDPAPPKK